MAAVADSSKIQIPFAEDIRQFPFAPLDVVVLPNGKEVKEHSLLPTTELEEAMDEFVCRMELPMETAEK
jgi:ATP-dependent DNA helicase 2 subunit 2